MKSHLYVSRTHLEHVPGKPAFKIEMSYKSMKNWDREQREPLLSKVTDRIHHQEPLKEKISQCVYKLKNQQNRLEGANLKTQQHDKTLFDKCVQAQMAKDTIRSAKYDNEIAESRKNAKD